MSKLKSVMSAVQLVGHGGIDQLLYREDVPVPHPAPGEVLIRVGACGTNNTDINTRTGWYNRSSNTDLSENVGLRGVEGGAGQVLSGVSGWNQSTVSFPRVQGAAIAGHIVAVGTGVGESRVGERVLVDPCIRDSSLPMRAQLIAYVGSETDGGFAEYVSIPTENAHAIKSSLSDTELATFPCSYDTAEEMLLRSRLSAGETIVITGAAGGVGTALIQLSLIRGARIVAIAGADKEARLRALGAHEFVAREREDLVQAVEAVIGAQAADVAADVVGGAVFAGLLKMLKRGGKYVTAGAIAGPVQQMDLRDLIYKDLEMYGVTCPTSDTFARVVSHIESGKLKPILERSYPLRQLQKAQSDMVKRSHVGKLVIELT
jgi:NADPH:quinone reductase-like Zn-dependent oxidoreductase